VRDTHPGDVALVHAAAGGTGGLLVQMLKQAGARVIATCGTKEEATLARESGADDVILYRAENFQERTANSQTGGVSTSSTTRSANRRLEDASVTLSLPAGPRSRSRSTADLS
jgi:NADPH2:quinone reductase